MFKSKFFKNNAILMVGTLAGGLLGYAFHFVVSRQMSVAQYGELQSLLSLSLIFGVFNAALGYFAIRHTAVFAAHNDQKANRDFTKYLQARALKFASFFLIILIVASPILAKILHFSSYVGFASVSLATFISTLTIVYSEILRGWGKFFWLTAIGITVALTKLLSGAALAIVFHSTAAVSFSFLLIAIVNWYLAKIWSKEKITGINNDSKNEPISLTTDSNSLDDTNWRNKYFPEANIRRIALKIFIFSLALVLFSNLDVILVKYFASADITGYFGAFNMLGKIVLFLNTTVIGVMLPEACADGHSGRRLRKKNLLRSYGLMTIIGIGAMVVFYFIPDFVINIFFGYKFIFDPQALWIFALISYLMSLIILEAHLSFAKRDFRVVYLLATTLVLMITGLAMYHSDLMQIALSLSVAFLIGYILIAILNLSQYINTKEE